jgi:hypothetical protein
LIGAELVFQHAGLDPNFYLRLSEALRIQLTP